MKYAHAPADLTISAPTTKTEPAVVNRPNSKTTADAPRMPSHVAKKEIKRIPESVEDDEDNDSEVEREKRLKELTDQVSSRSLNVLFSSEASFKTIFVSGFFLPRELKATRVIVGSLKIGYDIYPTMPWTRARNLFHPKCASIPLLHRNRCTGLIVELKFEVATMAFKTLRDGQPKYLSGLIRWHRDCIH